ncbi:MAG: DUF1127 domain-containing protein [Chloroflexi bacterium]|nr:DUF1127 domain-containing protein [Chloroflexota bacterium]
MEAGSRPASAIVRVAAFVVLAFRIRRERNQLAAMSPEQLADIGTTRVDANREAGRELFDIPDQRKSGLYL